VLAHLGGTSATARLIETPVSTVHSWKESGIPPARLAHIRLAAKTVGKPLPDDLSELLEAPESDAA